MLNGNDLQYTKPAIVEVGSMSDYVNSTDETVTSDGVVIILPGGGMLIQTESLP